MAKLVLFFRNGFRYRLTSSHNAEDQDNSRIVMSASPAAAPGAPARNVPSEAAPTSSTSSTTNPAPARSQQQLQLQSLSASPAAHPPAAFAYSGQADLFRSLQKDEYQLAQWREEISEFAGSVLGSRATRWEPEVDLIARGAYYGCTSLMGSATLGEEYCDLRQVTARHIRSDQAAAWRLARPAARAEDSVSALASATGPENTIAASSNAVAAVAASAFSSLSSPSGPASSISISPTYQWGIYTPYTLVSAPRRAALFSLQVVLPYLYDKAQQHSRRLLFSIPAGSGAPREVAGYRLVEVESHPWRDLEIRLKRLWNRCISWILRTDYSLLNHSARLHLALFYLFGRYLEWSKRLTGVRYAQLRAFDVARPGYQLFGALLMIQVSVGLMQLLKHSLAERARRGSGTIDGAEDEGGERLLPGLHAPSIVPADIGASNLYAPPSPPNEDDDGAGEEAREDVVPRERLQPQHRMPGHGHRLNEERKQDADEEEEEEEDEEDSDVPTCTLCLSPRENTTATECG